MVKLTLDINKSLEHNASMYYDKAKKAKKKIVGAKEALIESHKKLKKLEKEQLKQEIIEKEKVNISKEKEWYEKFHWFISSEGFLVIGGRDATTNEILIKKHTEKNDVVFHTDMVGSPFFVIKTNNKEPSEKTLREVADATVSYSKAWKLGIDSTPVFHCKPEQLTKEAKSGEFVPKGGFVTTGKLDYIDNKINIAIGMKDNKIMGGPLEAVEKNCEKFVKIERGSEKPSSVAKFILKKVGGDLDSIIRVLPSGGVKIKK